MENEIIEKAKQRFDIELHTDEYKAIHSDDKQLESLLHMFSITENGTYLDLGTGNGYIAFELAERFQDVSFMGLDIAEKSINTNNQIVKENSKNNIIFKSYEGKTFPFESSYFDGMISRYALHHFPNIRLSLAEINRVLKKDGFFILSDPMTFPFDLKGFIDAYQNLKDDGHKHFYYEDEIIDLFQQHSFRPKDIFYSYVRYPRPYDSMYKKVLENHPIEITNRYHVEIIDSKIYIEVKVMNILFQKTGNCL